MKFSVLNSSNVFCSHYDCMYQKKASVQVKYIFYAKITIHTRFFFFNAGKLTKKGQLTHFLLLIDELVFCLFTGVSRSTDLGSYPHFNADCTLSH